MKTIKIFTSPTCPNCPPAKVMGQQLQEKKFNIQLLDVSEAEGLAEAQIHRIMAVPTIVIADEEDNEIASWRSGLPSIDEVIEKAK
ncbi:MAG: thioredoxin family protein [bacterium]